MRIVIFTDANTIVTARLIRATLRWADRADRRVVAVVTSRPGAFPTGPLSATRPLARRILVALSNADFPLRHAFDARIDPLRPARRRGVPVVAVPGGDALDESDIVREVVAAHRPDVALSYYWVQRIGRRLRGAFGDLVNVHDGSLPDYRGVMATSFSIWAREARSGLTFHRVTAALDAGPVLHEGSVPLDGCSTLAAVSRAKSALAVAALPRVLDLVESGEPGRPPRQGGRTFTALDAHAMSRVSLPEHETLEAIERRIRAFGICHLTIAGRVWPVTRLRGSRPGRRLAFRTLDGRTVRPDRLDGLPALVHGIGRRASAAR